MHEPLPAGISKDDFFRLLGYKPHRGQQRIHRYRKRFLVAVCGRRWGKTIAAAREAGYAALTPGAHIYIVAPFQHLCARVFDRVWHDLIVKLRLPAESKSRSEMRLELPWSAVIEGRTAERPDNLVGDGLDFVVFDEAAKAKPGVWERYLLPSLMDKRGRALFITTPEGMNWVHTLYQRGRTPRERDWDAFTSPSGANPHIAKSELALMQRNMSQFAYAREILAEFNRSANLVYPAFSEERHVRPAAYDPRLHLYRALDFGYTNPFVCLTIQAGPGDEVRVLSEIYERGKTLTELAAMMQASLAPHYAAFRRFWTNFGGRSLRDTLPLHPLTGAPHFPTSLEAFAQCVLYFCDPAGAGERAHLQSLGLSVQARSRPIAYGMEFIRAALEGDGEKSRLVIDPRCTNLIREFLSYRYPDSGEAGSLAANPYSSTPNPFHSESPLKEDDHALDALRYFMGNMY